MPRSVMTDATVETFEELAFRGEVLVDIWGPDCQPCLALMPAVESLAERYRDRVRFVKVDAPENRKVCRDLRERRAGDITAMIDMEPVRNTADGPRGVVSLDSVDKRAMKCCWSPADRAARERPEAPDSSAPPPWSTHGPSDLLP